MDFDLRLPLGGMFTLFGLIIGTYGYVKPVQTLHINVNLLWGGVMCAFGLILLGLSRMDKSMIADTVDGQAADSSETIAKEAAFAGSHRD